MIFALDFKKSFNTAKGSLAFAHVALPGMGSRCPEGQGPSNIPVAGSEVTLAPAQSSTVPVANGAHGGGSVPENPLSPTPAPLPDLSLWGLQGGGHQEGAGAAEPTLTASNGEPVCPGAGDRSRSQEHGKAADQGQPWVQSFLLGILCFPSHLYSLPVATATSHHKLDGLKL